MNNLTEEQKAHIKANLSTEDYKYISSDFKQNESGKWDNIPDYDKIPQSVINDVNDNLDIIKKRIHARSLLNDIQTGDIVQYTDGSQSRVTMVHLRGENNCKVQTGGYSTGRGFFMFTSGRASYSGTLDEGLFLRELEATNEMLICKFWFFSKDWSGGNRGIEFDCPVRVWKQKKN